MADLEYKFFAVTISAEGGDVEMRRFREIPDLAAYLRKLPTSARGFAFRGERLDITSAPWRYLLCPGCPPIPLFDPPKVGRVDSSGGLGFADDGPLDRECARLTREMLEADAEKEAAVGEPMDVEIVSTLPSYSDDDEDANADDLPE